ncbi:TIGR04348 family glycosyltransferase [Amycolatopsis sp. TNS106]|nr:TIGR04348 family glycosyltransferase [Amycolatopsis sp. TNS106]
MSPAPPSAVLGNGVTADRWCRILADLGHEVETSDHYATGQYTGLIALHAGKSGDSVLKFRSAHPDAPVVLALTGTDLYPSLTANGVDPAVLAAADRIVVLQQRALDQVPPTHRDRTRVIVQSMPPIAPEPADDSVFEVAFLAHLRSVKDPLLAANAARLLPPESRIRITHVGAGLDDELAIAAKAEASSNARYDWLGALPRPEALKVLARSRLLILTSRHEGGANVVTEALAAGVPVLSTAIAGSVGLLGEDYPGYFPVGDAQALSVLLRAAELDLNDVYTRLAAACGERSHIVDPLTESNAWASLLGELSIPVPPRKDRACEGSPYGRPRPP